MATLQGLASETGSTKLSESGGTLEIMPKSLGKTQMVAGTTPAQAQTSSRSRLLPQMPQLVMPTVRQKIHANDPSNGTLGSSNHITQNNTPIGTNHESSITQQSTSSKNGNRKSNDETNETKEANETPKIRDILSGPHAIQQLGLEWESEQLAQFILKNCSFDPHNFTGSQELRLAFNKAIQAIDHTKGVSKEIFAHLMRNFCATAQQRLDLSHEVFHYYEHNCSVFAGFNLDPEKRKKKPIPKPSLEKLRHQKETQKLANSRKYIRNQETTKIRANERKEFKEKAKDELFSGHGVTEDQFKATQRSGAIKVEWNQDKMSINLLDSLQQTEVAVQQWCQETEQRQLDTKAQRLVHLEHANQLNPNDPTIQRALELNRVLPVTMQQHVMTAEELTKINQCLDFWPKSKLQDPLPSLTPTQKVEREERVKKNQQERQVREKAELAELSRQCAHGAMINSTATVAVTATANSDSLSRTGVDLNELRHKWNEEAQLRQKERLKKIADSKERHRLQLLERLEKQKRTQAKRERWAEDYLKQLNNPNPETGSEEEEDEEDEDEDEDEDDYECLRTMFQSTPLPSIDEDNDNPNLNLNERKNLSAWTPLLGEIMDRNQVVEDEDDMDFDRDDE
jgi:hypothetical protein